MLHTSGYGLVFGVLGVEHVVVSLHHDHPLVYLGLILAQTLHQPSKLFSLALV